ncbi:TIGR03086 family metal-binding protein [Jongsikchunia kroppenstedtii]|uniref:TIGR03086 family metal-binding protein n=1 Tax=Jongsikchunia kroppenstedtii TaxID=1121721 RepID=UPI00035E4623|nr:TIGR03086 family metal-binding protein [Jongsikchunia kroppenstedtii]
MRSVVDDLDYALDGLVRVVEQLRRDDWRRPTVCVGWSVSDVLAHIVSVTRKFTVFAAGVTDSPRGRVLDVADSDLPQVLVEAATDSARAWGRCDFTRTCHLPFGSFDADAAAAINMMDVLVHTWDIAEAVEADYTMPPRLVLPAIEIAQRVVTPEAVAARQFAAAVRLTAADSPEARLLAMTGRRPVR